MANETFIYKLNEFAKEVYEKYNISIMFCEIFGKRWAYVAGIDEEILFENKMLVNEKWGILYSGKMNEEVIEKVEKLCVKCK